MFQDRELSIMSAEPAEKRARMPLKLGYWKIRGLAQPIRLLLKYTGTEFEDVQYEQGDGPEFSREAWLSVKYTLGLAFPNLPYLIDGDIKMTQSNAAPPRFHGCKIKSGSGLGTRLLSVHELALSSDHMPGFKAIHTRSGSSEAERVVVDMLECEAMDFRNGFVRVCYNQSMESMRDDYLKTAKEKIKKFSDYLGEKQWFVGDQITYVDFVFYELLDQHRLFESTLLDDFTNIKAFLDRFEALQAIKDYMQSGEYMQRPVNNKIAQWK